ncbi:MAG: tryptophan synthase subunit alpha [Cyclobacteriaceae bacterium]
MENEELTMRRIEGAFHEREKVLNIYYTAGFPQLNDTVRVARALEESGADMLEIGIPFSDPVADGPTIQDSSKCALENGMTLSLLFEQLKELRSNVQIPVLLMGYVNPIIQFGIENFCRRCSEVGIDGTIIPDLPIQEYEEHYAMHFEKANLANIFLVSPNTSPERIKEVDEKSKGFVYMVSSAGVTGAKSEVQDGQLDYFKRIREMKLKSPKLIGFGISNSQTFHNACEYAEGAIIGSAFVSQLKKDASNKGIRDFIHSIRT